MSALNRDACLAIALALFTSGSFASCAWAGTSAQSLNRDLRPAKPTAAAKSGFASNSGKTHIGSNQSGRIKVAEVKLQAQTAKEDMPPVAPDRQAAAGDRTFGLGAAPAVSAPIVSGKFDAGGTTRLLGSTKQLLQLGAQRYAQGDTVGADASFRQVLVHDPNNVDALFNLGALSERRGELASARDFYRKALSSKQNDAELKQAVASVEDQLAGSSGQNAGSSSHKKPLYGSASATANNSDSMPPAAPPFLRQIARSGTAPLLGTVMSNNTASFQLGNPQQAQFGQQFPQQNFSVPVQTNRVPQLSVNQTPIGVANVTQPNFRQAIPLLHVGMGLVPGLRGMSCPVCGLLNKL